MYAGVSRRYAVGTCTGRRISGIMGWFSWGGLYSVSEVVIITRTVYYCNSVRVSVSDSNV